MSEKRFWVWAPAVLLTLGACATYSGVREQRSMPLRAPLDTSVPKSMLGLPSTDITISKKEQKVAGMDDYVLRLYAPEGAPESAAGFSVYVGYYERQSQGNTIHSPKNCLPGGGWEPLTSSREMVPVQGGEVPVNRYLIGNKDARALVLYWYQGRSRVEANEYAVKWHLLRDQALQGRSDEALVRIIVPVTGSEAEAYKLATQVVNEIVPAVNRALPS